MHQKSEMTLPYVKVGDYYYPNFAVPPPVGDIGFYGRLRRKCLIEHHPVLLNQLVLSGNCLSISPTSTGKQQSDAMCLCRR